MASYDGPPLDRNTLDNALESLSRYFIPLAQLETSKSDGDIRGGFGIVHRAKFKPGKKAAKQSVAVKELTVNLDKTFPLRVAYGLAREMRVWSRLKHSNVLDFVGYYLSENLDVAYLVSPYMKQGNIKEYLAKTQPDLLERARLMLDTLDGLEYLHSLNPPVCHGDLKSFNVLIQDNRTAVLCDFGLASVLQEEPSGLTTGADFKGSVRWCSPELIHGGRRNLKSDIWAWACLGLEIVTEELPYSQWPQDMTVLLRITQQEAPAPQQHPKVRAGLMGLFQLCWAVDPEERPRVDVVLKAFVQCWDKEYWQDWYLTDENWVFPCTDRLKRLDVDLPSLEGDGLYVALSDSTRSLTELSTGKSEGSTTALSTLTSRFKQLRLAGNRSTSSLSSIQPPVRSYDYREPAGFQFHLRDFITHNDDDWTMLWSLINMAWDCEVMTLTALDVIKYHIKNGTEIEQLSASRIWAIMLRQQKHEILPSLIGPATPASFLEAATSAFLQSSIDPEVKVRLHKCIAGASYIYGDLYHQHRRAWASIRREDEPVKGIPFDPSDESLKPPNDDPKYTTIADLPKHERVCILRRKCRFTENAVRRLEKAPNDVVAQYERRSCTLYAAELEDWWPWVLSESEAARARFFVRHPEVLSSTRTVLSLPEERLMESFVRARQRVANALGGGSETS